MKLTVTIIRIALLLLLMLVPAAVSCSDIQQPDLAELLDLNDRLDVSELDRLIRLVRDTRITREAAQILMVKQLADVRESYYKAGGKDSPKPAWYFPVAGRSINAITGGRQHGYIAQGYDFYAGNRHGGHPSLDIFIRDRNQDSRDDVTGTPVPVISISSGIVISAESEWQKGSRLRGGRYLWVYDPGNNFLFYYAHNDTLLVKTGDLVRPGDRIATVGRSGFNAAKRRSPTHLHLTVLDTRAGSMKPLDVYRDLARATSTP